MTQPQAQLRVSIHQVAPALGDVDANRSAMETAARQTDADILVFPELALTGYLLGHRARELGVALDGSPPLALPAGGPTTILGLVERGDDHLTYNAALVARGDEVVAVHRKLYLPTYGTFDEGRVFGRGRRSPRTFPLAPGWKGGILVCEDFWHPALAYLYALQEADVLFVLAAAPGRGEGGGGLRFPSVERWELIARTTALLHGVYLVLCNRVGTEDGVTFAGASMVVDPSGEVLARAPEVDTAVLDVTLDRERIASARQPSSHLRDEDPALTLHALERILRER